MEIRQLKYFVAAAEKLNFTEAAKACFITQSTLSVQIKSLEDELNVPLFDRQGKHIDNLTEAGGLFLQYAQNIINQSVEAKQAVDNLENLISGDLRVGVTYALSAVTIQALSIFAARFTGLQIYIEYGTSVVLESKLNSSELDIILTFHDSSKDPAVNKQFLFSSPLIVAVAKNHPFASLEKIKLKDLQMHELILPGKGFSTRTFLDSLFLRESIKPKVRMELNDVRSMLALVESGNWASILTKRSLMGWDNLVAIPIHTQVQMERNAYIFWKKDIYQKKSVTMFIKELDKQVAEEVGGK